MLSGGGGGSGSSTNAGSGGVLAFTGANVEPLLLIGALLLGSGLALRVGARTGRH